MIIIEHMKKDANAIKHADLGMLSFVLAMFVTAVFPVSFIWVLFASKITGWVIEFSQRVTRCMNWKTFKWKGFTGSHQNSLQESLLDVFQTWLFPVTYSVNVNSEKSSIFD